MPKKFLESLFPARKKQRRKTKTLMLESLEKRELFSVSPGPFALRTPNSSPVDQYVSNLLAQSSSLRVNPPASSYQDVEQNNTLSTANNIGTFGDGAYSPIIYGHIGRVSNNVVDGQDWYRIEVLGRTNASFTLSVARDLNLHLYNSTGQEITRSTNTGSRNDQINRTLDPGVYFIQVRQVGRNASEYSLRLNFTVQGSPVTPPPSVSTDIEPNSQRSQSFNVGAFAQGTHTRTLTGAVGATVVGTVDTQDWYRFDVTGRTNARLSLTGMSQDLDLHLLDSTGNEIDKSRLSGTADDTIASTLEPGTYYVQVIQFLNAESRYSLRFDLEVQAAPVTPPSSATDIEPNSQRSQSFNVGVFAQGTHTRTLTGAVGATVARTVDTQDWYRFEVTGRTNARLSLTGMTQDLDLYLLDSAGNEITNSRLSGTADDTIASNLEPGTYYAQVIQFLSSESSYSLRLDLEVQAAPVTPPQSATDIEPNNERTQAHNIGTFVQGTHTRNLTGHVGHSNRLVIDTQDWYRFEVTGRTSARIKLSGMTQDLDLSLLSSTGSQVGSSSRTGTADDEITMSLEPGTYFIQVRRFDSSVSAYSLEVNLDVQATAQPTPITPVDPTSGAIELGTLRRGTTFRPRTGQINGANSEMYYRVNVDSYGRIRVRLQDLTDDLDIQIVNRNGQVFASSTRTGTQRDEISTTLPSGTWFVRVYQGTASASSRFTLNIAAS